MTESEVLNLKLGDSFTFPDHYTNSEMKVVNHNYECKILAVIVDDGVVQGFTIKRKMVMTDDWKYEFFSSFKVRDLCKLNEFTTGE